MSPYAPAAQADVFAADAAPAEAFSLSRAFVVTKEACRSFRSRMRNGRPLGDGADADGQAEGPALGVAATARARRAAARKPAAVPAVLTPWDLLDEDASPAGVTFAEFQRRPRLSPLHPLPGQQQQQQQQAA